MALAGRVHQLGAVEAVDRLGHEALVERTARGLDLADAVAAGRFGFGENAPVGFGDRRRAERLVRMRRLAVHEPDLAGARPFGLEVVDRRNDGADDARHQRKAVLGVADRIGEHVARLERAVVAQQQHPAVERAGHDGGQQSGAGHLLEAHRGEARDGRVGRKRSLSADHLRRVRAGAQHDRRQFAARPVEVRLDDLQHEAGRDRGIERVAAALEHRHAGLCRQPVRGRDRAERAADIRSGGELHLLSRVSEGRCRAGREPAGLRLDKAAFPLSHLLSSKTVPMTWSIIARDPSSGAFGVAVASKFFAVGAICPHGEGGVGALSTQALPNPLWGYRGMRLLARGHAGAGGGRARDQAGSRRRAAPVPRARRQGRDRRAYRRGLHRLVRPCRAAGTVGCRQHAGRARRDRGDRARVRDVGGEIVRAPADRRT